NEGRRPVRACLTTCFKACTSVASSAELVACKSSVRLRDTSDKHNSPGAAAAVEPSMSNVGVFLPTNTAVTSAKLSDFRLIASVLASASKESRVSLHDRMC